MSTVTSSSHLYLACLLFTPPGPDHLGVCPAMLALPDTARMSPLWWNIVLCHPPWSQATHFPPVLSHTLTMHCTCPYIIRFPAQSSAASTAQGAIVFECTLAVCVDFRYWYFVKSMWSVNLVRRSLRCSLVAQFVRSRGSIVDSVERLCWTL